MLPRPQYGQAFPLDRQQGERPAQRGAASESLGISSQELAQVLPRIARLLDHRITFLRPLKVWRFRDSTVRPPSGPTPRPASSLLVGAAFHGALT
jgi:hypothetical protein